jgi:hypothetical protein
MTREQRDAAKQRVVALGRRLDAIQTLTENMSDQGGIEIAIQTDNLGIDQYDHI